MANLLAIHSVSNSILNYLRNDYQDSLPRQRDIHCDFQLLASDDINDPGDYTTMLTLYLYRIMPTAHRQQVPTFGQQHMPLSLDLHFLMTIWTDRAMAEQMVMAWAMHHLHRNPVLNISTLSPEANWNNNDQVQITPNLLSNEDMMRIWDAFETPYHLSTAYIARVVFIEDDPIPANPPVVAKQLQYGDLEVEV